MSQRLIAILSGVSMLVAAGQSEADPPQKRDSRLFQVDYKGQKILGPAAHVPGYLGLRLVSVSTDQPQYWPNEKVHLKVVMPGRPGETVKASLQKRDANVQEIPGVSLDSGGVSVSVVLDGEKKRLELGEYRLTVKSSDGKLQGDATFSVVEGSLGSLSLAYEFKQVTRVEDLDKSKGGWFLGNASRPGMRWGNGLSFKNELRLSNQPYEGPVELVSRCMLPGCNGVDAGPRKKLVVRAGLLAETMEVGGHSGPFQIELITPKGSLRHQFEGSSHVERDMVSVCKGVHYHHRAGLAPYEGTVQVPGRSIFVVREKETAAEDAFEVASVIAEKRRLTVKVRKDVSGAVVHLWQPAKGDGFELSRQTASPSLRAGDVLSIPIPQPFGLVAVGGFHDGKLVEGYAIGFAPADLTARVEAPPQGAPGARVAVKIRVTGEGGAPVKGSGILEAFDNRVASRSPASALSSAIGDSVRNVSNSLSAWVDPLELERMAREEEKRKREVEVLAPAEPAPSDDADEAAPPSAAKATLARLSGSGRGGGGRTGPGSLGEVEDESEEGEAIREGERKVVFCGRVETDASGSAEVELALPPQTGRLAYRFVAFQGLDYASANTQTDVSKRAYVEARLPQTFVPGTRLDLRVFAVNTTGADARLVVSGAGMPKAVEEDVPPGQRELTLPWHGTESGKLVLTLLDGKGKALDRREMAVRDVSTYPVTFSRLEFGGRTPIELRPGETAVVYEGPGALLRGTVTNLVTTMYSWFGHAEALSASVAVRATVLAAIRRGIISDEGLLQTLRVDLDKAVRDLEERFFDKASGLVRPYPGLAPNPLWSAWTSRNLHSALAALKGQDQLQAQMKDAVAAAKRMVAAIDASLMRSGFLVQEQGGYDPEQDGLSVIPVEVDGKVLYRVLTDSAVQVFVVDKLLPVLDPGARNDELRYAKALDTFRFLRAFERTGLLQYLAESAKGLWLAGPARRDAFDKLFALIARGFVFTQEPGLIQGPALLGGVYSTPMGLLRFLELLLLTGERKATDRGAVLVQGGASSPVDFGKPLAVQKKAAVQAPSGAVVRIDQAGQVSMVAEGKPAFARVSVEPGSFAVAQEATLTVELDAGRDPLEYYAMVAVPTTTAVKQTEDILSDYKGGLLYGQQGMGAQKMQVLAVPFRGSRTVRLLLEGLYPGTSDALVAVRHLSNPADICTVRLPGIVVE